MRYKLKILKLISTCCSFIYYLMDNIVWLSGMNFVGRQAPYFGYKWKNVKNVFSLCKTVLEIIISIYNIYQKEREEIRLRVKLRDYDG
jgi:hypothetical protein